MIYQTLLLPVMLINGISDLRERNIWEFPFLVMLATGLILSDHPIVCFIGLLLIVSEKILFMKQMGVGDLEALILLYAAMGLNLALIAYLTLTMLPGWYLVTKDTSIPLVTFLAAGYVTWYLCCIIIFGGL